MRTGFLLLSLLWMAPSAQAQMIPNADTLNWQPQDTMNLGQPEQAYSRPDNFKYIPYPQPLPAPEVTWQDRAGKAVALKDLKGYVVVVNFWATWCGPCVMEMPELDALQQRYGSAGLLVAAVSVDEGGLNTIESFYKEHNIRNLPVFSDPTADAPASFNVRTLPASFVIDRDGQLVGMLPGYGSWMSDSARMVLEDTLRRQAIHNPDQPKFDNVEIMDVAP
ncbi:MAG: redoxin domain-containing protein [Proteobacteria bacterium]|nr:redoxin domain-containing protein [Pseudomonadota bacterium]